MADVEFTLCNTMADDNFYINSEGKRVDIGAMPNAHLLNAFNKYNQRAKQIRAAISAKGAPVGAVFNHLESLDEIIKKLKIEIEKRGLMSL